MATAGRGPLGYRHRPFGCIEGLIRRHYHVPARLTPTDQDYEYLRTDMATLFSHLGI